MATLQGAIDLLSETTTAKSAPPERAADNSPQEVKFTPTVISMCKQVIKDFPADFVFDTGALKKLTVAAFPDHAAKIKSGIYPALTVLKDKVQIKLVPGGFTRTDTFVYP